VTVQNRATIKENFTYSQNKSCALFAKNGMSSATSSQKWLSAALLNGKSSVFQTRRFSGKLGRIHRTLGNILFDFDQKGGGGVYKVLVALMQKNIK